MSKYFLHFVNVIIQFGG